MARGDRSRGRGSERGQIVPLVALVVAAVGLLCLGLGRLGGAAVASTRAGTAADAAALAGAADGEAAARALARANGASLVDYRRLGDRVEVTVEVRGHRATARAEVTGGRDTASWFREGWDPGG
ncbi:MAG: pilus assembly protein TadG-related protein [Acidimicrobiia bacterium]